MAAHWMQLHVSLRTGLFVITVFGVFGKRVNDGRRQFCSQSKNEHSDPIFFFLNFKVLVAFEKMLGAVFAATVRSGE